MNGVVLEEMSASDMLDVIHYFFESDISASSLEQLEARDRSRKLIYRDFYGYEYQYSVTEKSNASSMSGIVGEPLDNFIEDDEEHIVPFDPMKRPTKPYIAPTQGDARSSQPFGALLDGPLGH